MRTNFLKLHLLIPTALGILLFPLVLQSAESYTIAAGATTLINEHGTCQKVTNSHGSLSLWIPTKTSTEWSSFRASPGFGVLAPCGACNLPWGGSISHGATVTAYSSSLPTGACSSVSEVRSCYDGTLSGSFTNQSCTNGCTGTPWGAVASGYSNTAYSTGTPAAACSTVAQTRTCTNGTMSGTFTITSCLNGCTGTPWGAVASGYSNTAYSTGTPAAACSTVAQTRTCTNGTMSGTFTVTSCLNGCTGTPWGAVASGYSNTAYSTGTPAAACSTVAQTRTCTNGTMSGTFTITSCLNGCTGTPWGSVASGFSGTAYSVNTSTNCAANSQTRTCTNGTMSGSFAYTTCSGCAAANNTTNMCAGYTWCGTSGCGEAGRCASGSASLTGTYCIMCPLIQNCRCN